MSSYGVPAYGVWDVRNGNLLVVYHEVVHLQKRNIFWNKDAWNMQAFPTKSALLGDSFRAIPVPWICDV